MFTHLLDADLFFDDLLLLHSGLNLVGLVRGRLLCLHRCFVLGTLGVEIAHGLCLSCLTRGLRDDFLLLRDCLRDLGLAHRLRAFDGRVPVCLRRGDVGSAPDEGDVRTAHVQDVLVVVTHLTDGERDHLESHLAHVFGHVRPHAIGDHFRFLDDVLDRQLTDDAAQMPLHDQANQVLSLDGIFVQELFGGGQNADRIRLDLDLRHRLDVHRDALAGIEVLRRCDIEAHQLE
jgi:hypothetical protein